MAKHGIPVALAIMAILVVACGGDGSSPAGSPTPDSTATLTATPSPTAALPTPSPEASPAPEVRPCVSITSQCEAQVTNVAPQRLNTRDAPTALAELIGKLSEGEVVCLAGASIFADGFQWWPLHTAEGTEGWSAAFDPDQPERPWLTVTGQTCREAPEPTPTATPTVGSQDNPVPLGEPHLVQGWELTVLGSPSRTECAPIYDPPTLTFCSDTTLAIVNMRARNVSAGDPADFNSVGSAFGLVDVEGGVHQLDSVPAVIPFFEASTSVFREGATVEGPVYFSVPLDIGPLLLLTGDGTFFSTE